MTRAAEQSARTGEQTGPDREVDRGADRALDVLAATHRAALGLLDARWSDARAALEAGAGVDRVAAVMDLTIPQVIAGVREWADRAVRDGRLTGPDADRVRALVAGWPGAPGRRTGPDRSGWSSRVDSYGQPRCLPGCTITDVWNHFCLAPVGAVPTAPGPDGSVDRLAVQVDQCSDGRFVVVSDRDAAGYLHGDVVVLAPETVPLLVSLLLDAHRSSR